MKKTLFIILILIIISAGFFIVINFKGGEDNLNVLVYLDEENMSGKDYNLSEVHRYINYGDSKILLDTNLDDTLFTIESRLFYKDEEFYLTADMPLEYTFSNDSLFQETNVKISFIFFNNSNSFINFRRNNVVIYKNLVKEDFEVKKLISTNNYQMIGTNEVRNYMDKRYKFIGITIYYVNNSKVVLEYPIKTINWLEDGEIFQSDTGKILFVNPKTESLDIGYIIVSSFNNTEIKLDYGNKEIYKINAKNYILIREIK